MTAQASSSEKKKPPFGGFLVALFISGVVVIGGVVLVNTSERNKELDARDRARRGGRKHPLPG